jgi:phenylalanyl-tRNA synthetase beta subunit
MIGEIRPEVLQAFNLRMPAAALELNINQAIKTEAKQHK